MLPENISITVVPRSDDGRLDTQFLDGNVNPATDVSASQMVPDDLLNTTASAFNLGLTPYFSGADVALGTVTFEPSIGTLAAVGLSVVSEALSGAAPVEGVLSGRATWVNDSDATDVRRTNVFTVSFVDPASVTDTTAPTKVVGVTATVNGGSVTIEHDPASDPHDGVSPGSGLYEYSYQLSGVEQATEVAAAGLSPAYTSGDIGTLTPAGTSNEAGAGGTDTSEGFIGENSGPDAFSDRFHYSRMYQHSGNFSRSVQLVSISGSTVNYDKAGVMARFGMAQDDPFIFAHIRSSGKARLEYRAVKGGNRVTIGSASITLPCFITLNKTGSVWTMYLSADGNAWQNIASVTLATPSSFNLMRATCSTSDGNAITVVYDNDSFWSGARLSKVIASSDSGPWTVTANDAENNVGAASADVTALASSGSVFPGTNLKFYPGFVITANENESVSLTESRWQELFTASPNRKESYRPPGIYGGITRRLNWLRYYVNQSVRPTDPSDHTDPAYDWSLLDAAVNLNCVQNEGALVMIAVGEVGVGGYSDAPAWLSNATFNGTFNSGLDGGSSASKITPKYYRYAAADNRGYANVGAAPAIVEEFLYFNQALHDHLVATGNIDKVMFLTLSEFYVSSNAALPSDYGSTDFAHGVGTRAREIASIWAASQVHVQMSSLTGSRRNTFWQYMDEPLLGITFPDMKMNGTNNISASGIRFSHPDGTYQKDTRPLSQLTGGNGQRENTYFAPGIANPWGYSGVTVPQTASHILWALSGAPTGANKDSGLGQSGDDPAGILPVHTIIMDWGRSWQRNSPSLGEWHAAIDAFGPSGTFAFPYLPPGYAP